MFLCSYVRNRLVVTPGSNVRGYRAQRFFFEAFLVAFFLATFERLSAREFCWLPVTGHTTYRWRLNFRVVSVTPWIKQRP